MLVCFLTRSLLNIPHLVSMLCKLNLLASSLLFFFSIHVFSNDYKVVFGNASIKRRLLVVEGDNVCFITGTGGTVAVDDCCAGVAVKGATR